MLRSDTVVTLKQLNLMQGYYDTILLISTKLRRKFTCNSREISILFHIKRRKVDNIK